MSEILIDVTRLLGRFMKGRLPTGVDRVSQAYVRHFADRARAKVRFGGRAVVLSPSESQSLFHNVLNPPADPAASCDFGASVIRRVGQEFLRVRRGSEFRGAFLFNTGHSGLEQEGYPMQLQRLGVRPLFLVHDLIPITHPEYCRAGELDKHVVRMNAVLSAGSGVITNSRATLDELERFAVKAGRAMPPSVAAPLGPAELPAPSHTRPLSEPYFVVLSTIEARKNHWMLLQVWRKLVERHGDRAPKLVVIGQRGWECENVVDLLERCQALHGAVIELPSCTDADLATYLHHAQALLFPSFAEGYGMPLVEALASGAPVIASDLPAFREIAGDIPEYLDPLDGMGWLARIEAYAGGASPEREAQLKRMDGFVAPAWSAHFEAVEHLLERLG
jgi:glycosyltransferase involved in cell wall biosynthesis